MRVFVDEAGRGPLAGPLYVGLVLENKQRDFDQVDAYFMDSKQLSPAKRVVSYRLLQQMRAEGLQATTAFASAEEIDRFGVTKAIVLAIVRGLYLLSKSEEKKKVDISLSFSQMVDRIKKWMQEADISLMIDGKSDFGLRKLLDISVATLVRGDAHVGGIAMASILAKVERDLYMEQLHLSYPEREFAIHKGYGTKRHYQLLEQYGISDQHRKLFLKQYFPGYKFEEWNPDFIMKITA